MLVRGRERVTIPYTTSDVFYDERLQSFIDVTARCYSDVVDLKEFSLFPKEEEFLFAPHQYMEIWDFKIKIGDGIEAHIVHEIHPGT